MTLNKITWDMEGVTTTAPFTDRSDLDGPFMVPFCGTLQVTEISENLFTNFDMLFEVWGITKINGGNPWKP